MKTFKNQLAIPVKVMQSNLQVFTIMPQTTFSAQPGKTLQFVQFGFNWVKL